MPMMIDGPKDEPQIPSLRWPEGKPREPVAPSLHWPGGKPADTPPRDSYKTAKPTEKTEGKITCWGGTLRAAVLLGLHVDLGICKEADGIPMPRVAAGLDLFTVGASASVYTETVEGSYNEFNTWPGSATPVTFFDMLAKIELKESKPIVLHEHIESKSHDGKVPYMIHAHTPDLTVTRDEHFIGLQTSSIGEMTFDYGALIFSGLSEVVTSIQDKIVSWLE